MALSEFTEHSILNHFRLNRLSSESEMEIDMKNSGVGFTPTWDFAELVKRGYFEQQTVNGVEKFKLNELGLARFYKLDAIIAKSNLPKKSIRNTLVTTGIGTFAGIISGLVVVYWKDILKFFHLSK